MQLFVLPLPSVTIHVTMFVPRAKIAEASFVTVATLQLSLVTDVPRLTFVAVQPALADTVTSAGQLIVGLVVSRTITRCAHVLVLPLPSVTVHTTKLVPRE